MKIRFLLLGTSLSLVPQSILAAECAVTDCSLLGYTDSACPGSGLKCPFGEGWYCGGGAAEDCIKLGYDKSCTGAGESGSGETCNGKYKTCTCDSSYKYTCSGTGYSGGSGLVNHPILGVAVLVNAHQLTNTPAPVRATRVVPAPPAAENIPNAIVQVIIVGMVAVVFCLVIRATNTLAPAPATQAALALPVVASMRLVPAPAAMSLYYCNGTVVGVKTSNMGFYVAMKDLGRMNWSSAYSQCQNYSFCGNVKGTLPIVDQLKSIYQNKSRVNSLLSTNGGTQLTNSYYWSSSNYGYYYYFVNMSDGNVLSSGNDYGNRNYVRPVLTSW